MKRPERLLRRGLSAEALRRVVDGVAPGGRVVWYRALRGGISASVHVVRVEAPDRTRRDAVVRRFAAPWHRADPDVCTREFRVLQELARCPFPAPRPLLLDQDGGPFGAPTVVTSRLPGRPALRPPNMDGHVRQMAATLGQLHRVSSDSLAFLPDQAVLLAKSLNERKVADDPLEPGLRAAVLGAWPAVAASVGQPRLVHGDYWPGNLLWQRGRLTGVVDWEDARLGDPARDVATCRADLTILFGQHAADGFLRAYEAATGHTVRALPFWDLLTCTLALPEVERWPPGWQALGRPDLTVEAACERLRGLARRALQDSRFHVRAR